MRQFQKILRHASTNQSKPAAALFMQMQRLIEKKDKVNLARFLDGLQYDQSITKSDRYDLLMQARCMTFDTDGIKNTLHEMHKNGVKPGRIALRALIQYHVEVRDLEGAEQLCLSLPKYGESGLDAYMTCTMIAGWGRHGMVQRAESLFQKCPELHDNAVLMTAMMTVYFEAKQYEKALKLFDTMTVAKPDAVMRKLRCRCLMHSGNTTAAVVEWRKIQNLLGDNHWMDMARMFVDSHPDLVLSMANEALCKFTISHHVCELVALAIRKACQSEEQVVNCYTNLRKQAPPTSFLSSPLVAMADRVVDFPNLRLLLREQLDLLGCSLPALTRITVASKLDKK